VRGKVWLVDLVYLVSLVCLVYFVGLVCLVDLVRLLIGPKKPEQPDQLIQPERAAIQS
jgi:hypothetical protein